MSTPLRQAALAPCSAFPAVSLQGAGSVVTTLERNELGLARVVARRRGSAALEAIVRARFAIELPRGSHRVSVAKLAFCGTGPGAWLAIREESSNSLAAILAEALDGVASVSDQSDAYAVLRLTGPRVRDTLCKLVPIDLHPRTFGARDFATTVAGYIEVLCWRLPDDTQGAPVFELAVPRGFAEDFWHLLSLSAAEFGEISAAPAGQLG